MTVPDMNDALRFYFERQAMIDQWALLPAQGVAFANEFFASLAAPIAEQAMSRGGASDRWSVGSTDLIGLYRREWVHEVQPRVTVALGWTRAAAGFTGSGVPWVGIRVRRSGPHAKTAAHVLDHVASAERLEVVGPIDPSDQLWPRWRRVPPASPAPWDHLQEYASASFLPLGER